MLWKNRRKKIHLMIPSRKHSAVVNVRREGSHNNYHYAKSVQTFRSNRFRTSSKSCFLGCTTCFTRHERVKVVNINRKYQKWTLRIHKTMLGLIIRYRIDCSSRTRFSMCIMIRYGWWIFCTRDWSSVHVTDLLYTWRIFENSAI